MASPKLDKSQLAELTRRGYQKAKERRTAEIIEKKDNALVVDIDTAITSILVSIQKQAGQKAA